jgi:outer membrane lipoprotein carrier protein
MTLRRSLLLALTATLLTSAPAWANDNIAQLRAFLDGTKTLRANFTQTLLRKGQQGKQSLQASSGEMAISRPGKFRWQIVQPYPQLMVSDGQKVWLHDPELNQVTVRKIGQALNGTPAALLAGDGALDKHFTLRDLGEKDGLGWVEAVPKSNDGGFERVLLGFAGDSLKSMTLADNFGQTTVLIFSRIERNPTLAPGLFRFTPPNGADVVGE